MKQHTTSLVFLILVSGSVWGGSKTQISSVEDLKDAIYSPNALETVKSAEEWLPGLVASLRWKTVLSEHFILNLHVDKSDQYEPLCGELLVAMEKLHSELQAFFQVKAESKTEQLALQTRLVCFVVKTRSERTFGTLPDPHLLFYFLDPENDPDYLAKMRHELAHWFWGRVFGEAPPLFNEGVAVYAEKMAVPGSTESWFLENHSLHPKDFPPLREVIESEGFWKHRGMYTISGLWVHFLVSQWGWSKLKDFFLSSDFEDQHVAEHFEEVYGERLESVESHWHTYLAEKGIL